jgi:hypothetical protein
VIWLRDGASAPTYARLGSRGMGGTLNEELSREAATSGIRRAVETGTYYGDSAIKLSRIFERVETIELNAPPRAALLAASGSLPECASPTWRFQQAPQTVLRTDALLAR